MFGPAEYRFLWRTVTTLCIAVCALYPANPCKRKSRRPNAPETGCPDPALVPAAGRRDTLAGLLE